MNLYKADTLSNISWIEHGFGRRDVSLDDYLANLGLKNPIFARTNQKHGNRVRALDEDLPKKILDGDAFITQSPNVVCFVRTADCVPILLCDPENRAVGAIHAGWRGHICDVIGSAVRAMKETFGSDASKLLAAVGPSICRKCYEVGEEVVEAFRRRGFADECIMSGRFFLNLEKASQDLLIAAGVRYSNISVLPLCTSCHNGDFASYRCERTEKSRQVNFIYIVAA